MVEEPDLEVPSASKRRFRGRSPLPCKLFRRRVELILHRRSTLSRNWESKLVWNLQACRGSPSLLEFAFLPPWSHPAVGVCLQLSWRQPLRPRPPRKIMACLSSLTILTTWVVNLCNGVVLKAPRWLSWSQGELLASNLLSKYFAVACRSPRAALRDGKRPLMLPYLVLLARSQTTFCSWCEKQVCLVLKVMSMRMMCILCQLLCCCFWLSFDWVMNNDNAIDCDYGGGGVMILMASMLVVATLWCCALFIFCLMFLSCWNCAMLMCFALFSSHLVAFLAMTSPLP